jgi:Secretion system C-terminal sorting domain
LTLTASAQTPGTLTFSYNQPQPTNPPPNAGIKNVYAVWIESNSGTFIKTKNRFVANGTKDHLPTWAVKSGGTLSNATAAACNTTDATIGATRTTSTTPTAYGTKTVTWDAKNVVGTVNGTTVADGVYKIWIESSWVDSGSNNHNELIGFTFTKGPTAVHLTPAGDTYINTVVLDWVPSGLGIEDVKNQEPAVVIYPVPSKGIFNIDVKNELQSIRVYNLLGQTIYTEENINMTSEGTKTIDLSNASNGNYVISLTNEYGTSSYEVIVSK